MKIRWLTQESEQFLKKDYLLPGIEVKDRIDQICDCAEKILNKKHFAKQFKENLYKGWYSLSSPIWSNFGLDRGLPISCYSSYIIDSTESLLDIVSEIGIMSKYGGGTSAYFGNVRPRGSDIKNNGKTSGAVHFMSMYESVVNTISQGSSRKGQCAAYLPIDHGDIEEFLDIRSQGHPIQFLSTGVTIKDEWMKEMVSGDKEKRKIWAKVLKSRKNTGYPYLFFYDNVNNNRPKVYKDKNRYVYCSNLCNETTPCSSETETFVCDLSSMNILYYDEWKNTEAVELLTYFLDAVMTDFINKASNIKHMERAVKFAKNHRSLGIGWLGYHSYLQSKMIPFESMEAKRLNIEIAKTIYNQSQEASKKLAVEYGEPELLKGYGLRNTLTTAIAPTKSSAFIIGQVSEGIEPHHSNYYIKDLQKGKFTVKNKELEKLLESKNKNDDETWDSILKHQGSVQHLDFLDQNEKDVFKTFCEISPMEVIIQAASRQKYIDQGQSLNLMIDPKTPTKDVNALIIKAWELGIKGLYYNISFNAAKEFSRSILSCSSCES